MLSAQEARTKSQSKFEENQKKYAEQVKKEVQFLEESINEKIDKGEFSCYIEKWVSEKALAEIKKLGYEIKKQEGSVLSGGVPITVISW